MFIIRYMQTCCRWWTLRFPQAVLCAVWCVLACACECGTLAAINQIVCIVALRTRPQPRIHARAHAHAHLQVHMHKCVSCVVTSLYSPYVRRCAHAPCSTILGGIRWQSLQRAWKLWSREVLASTDHQGRTSHASCSTSCRAAGLVSRVTLVKAFGLGVTKGSAPNPMAHVHLTDAEEGSKTFATSSVAKTANPHWRFSFVFRHGDHDHHSGDDRVDIVVWHHEKGMLSDSKTFLGHAALPLSHFVSGSGVCGGWHELRFNREYANSPLQVSGKIYIELETVDTEGHPDMVFPWVTREQELARHESADGKRRLRVTLSRAEQLLAMDKGGTSDPFARLSFGSQSLESKVVPKTLNPQFDQSFTFNWPSGGGALRELSIALFDHDKGFFGSSSEYLGSVCLHEDVLSLSHGLHWHALEFHSKYSNKHYDVTGRILVEVQVLSAGDDAA